jgi:broad specificity phosphatase PhoE
MKSNIKNIYIIRHGETDWNKEGKTQGGEADIPLNETGKEQSKKLALYFKQYRLQKHNIDCIWTSPLSRAKETAEIIKQNININSLKIYDELKEVGMGKLSGLKKTDELRKSWIDIEKKSIETMPMIEFDEQTLNLMIDADNKLKIGIEKQESIIKRCNKIINEIKSSLCNNIIIVTHSGLISSLLSLIYNLPLSIINTGGNCSLSYHQYNINNDKFVMISSQNNQYLNLINLENFWNKLKIIKSLGRGNSGETFLIELNRKEYAMKRQKIVEEDMPYINAVIDFFKWIEQLNNDDKIFFMNLHFYRIYNDCDFDFKPMRGELDEKYKTSRLCFDMIIDIKDGTVDKIIDNFTTEQIMSAFLQATYAIYLMHNSGYYHFDTKTDNISYNKTTSKKINIGKFGEINTFGYLFGFIDYDNIMHNKFGLDAFDKKMLDSMRVINGDLSNLIDYVLFNNIKLYSQIEKSKINFKPKEIYDMIKLFSKEKYNNVIKFISKYIKEPYVTEFLTIPIDEIKKEPNYRSLLYEIMQILQIKYPNSYHKIVEDYFGMKLKKLNYFVSKKDMLYIKKNQHKLKKILKKFISYTN